MVTLTKSAVFKIGDHLEGEQEFRGLSTDTKPTDAINGAAFVEGAAWQNSGSTLYAGGMLNCLFVEV